MKEAAVYDGTTDNLTSRLGDSYHLNFLGQTKAGEKKDTSKALPDAYSPKYVEVRSFMYILETK